MANHQPGTNAAALSLAPLGNVPSCPRNPLGADLQRPPDYRHVSSFFFVMLPS
jgi:hypothetical protein